MRLLPGIIDSAFEIAKQLPSVLGSALFEFSTAQKPSIRVVLNGCSGRIFFGKAWFEIPEVFQDE